MEIKRTLKITATETITEAVVNFSCEHEEGKTPNSVNAHCNISKDGKNGNLHINKYANGNIDFNCNGNIDTTVSLPLIEAIIPQLDAFFDPTTLEGGAV
jgi:hypothetical protein